MFAVVKSGGKQYTIKEGDILKLEKLGVEEGKTTLNEVLLIASDGNITTGNPFINGASVEVEIVSTGKLDRILVFKRKRRKDYRKRIGHRQQYSEVKVLKINK